LVFLTDDIRLPRRDNEFGSGRPLERPGREQVPVPSPPLQSGRERDDMAEIVVHADRLSRPTDVQGHCSFAGNQPAYPYREVSNKVRQETRKASVARLATLTAPAFGSTILSKIDEEGRESPRTRFETLSSTAFGSLTLGGNKKVPAPSYIAPGQYDPTLSSSRSHKETNASRLGYTEQSRLRSYVYADYSDPTRSPERWFVDLENSRMPPDYAYRISLNAIVFLVFVIVLCIIVGVVVGIELSHRKH
jgi:hypothetical protein